ncbi:MAG TPA: thioredoxin domain-containing protein [Acidimicrobiales bacterium]|nr:thioredoxin domain-containing protein [Acidimicrobiales bacterium]
MTTTNRLALETSPYLRQHADNPVDWYPWGPEAFEAAKSRDVPILLSVGYSACHWCHVMAHECFEDEEVASAMNAGFVSVKVDREERPDVDSIYMEAVQAVTGSGGWPMTVLLTPDGRPFHGGTYFPKRQFLSVLEQVGSLWRERRADLYQAADQLSTAVRTGTGLPSRTWAAAGDAGAAGSPGLLAVTADALLQRFDPEWGGFGRSPKFPQPPMLETLLLAATETGRSDLADALVTTLDAMASGGIYDHLGGGFARYSTDRAWLVPHFEKMLYDNALLARVYLHAFQATGSDRYRQVVSETLGYVLSPPMSIAGAGFASAEDADSEGVEGRFYVWDRAEVLEVAGPHVADWYGVTETGNWEGRNILTRPQRGVLARPADVEAGRQALFERRSRRVRPGLDDKVLTEWNAMAVAALAEAGRALDQPSWVAEAERVAEFLLANLRRPDGRWLRSWQAAAGGPPAQRRPLAYASDHAWLVEAFTRLAEATGRSRWVTRAVEAADALVDLFWDDGAGAFVTAGRDGEALIASPVDTHDGALPSANSVAATALIRLSALTGEDRYRARAAAVVEAMAPALGAAPIAFSGMVAAAALLQRGTTEIVVTGDRPDLVSVVTDRYLPLAVWTWGEPFESPLWDGRTGTDAADRAYVCRDYACRAPVSEPAELRSQLETIHPSLSADR